MIPDWHIPEGKAINKHVQSGEKVLSRDEWIMFHFLFVTMQRLCGVTDQTCKCHARGEDPFLALLRKSVEAALASTPEAKP